VAVGRILVILVLLLIGVVTAMDFISMKRQIPLYFSIPAFLFAAFYAWIFLDGLFNNTPCIGHRMWDDEEKT